jgi:hypothetical protein
MRYRLSRTIPCETYASIADTCALWRQDYLAKAIGAKNDRGQQGDPRPGSKLEQSVVVQLPFVVNAAAQARTVSADRIRLDPWKSAGLFKAIICDDMSEFESNMPSHAVRSPPARIQDSQL